VLRLKVALGIVSLARRQQEAVGEADLGYLGERCLGLRAGDLCYESRSPTLTTSLW